MTLATTTRQPFFAPLAYGLGFMLGAVVGTRAAKPDYVDATPENAIVRVTDHRIVRNKKFYFMRDGTGTYQRIDLTPAAKDSIDALLEGRK